MFVLDSYVQIGLIKSLVPCQGDLIHKQWIREDIGGMTTRTIKWLIFCVLALAIITWLVPLVKRSIPYRDSDELFATAISIDSIRYLGPTVMIRDNKSGKFYWIKSYTSVDPPNLDTLRFKTADVRYLKFLAGPLENRIVYMKVDSVIILNQLVER